MTKTLKNKVLITIVTLFVFMLSVVCVTSTLVTATTVDHDLCADSGKYCLVCDVAEKVNAIPDAEDITIDNAAKVMQQINDIDRIKYDLSDDEYEELLNRVATQQNASGNGLPDIAKYVNAVNKIKELTGVKLAISKSLNLGNGVEIADLSEAEVSFEITNVDTNATQTLTLFDLGTSTSAFGADFYTAEQDGWTYTYLLPAGTYTVKEINQNEPITVNGNECLFTCAEVSDGNVTETGADAVDGMTIDLIPGSSASVLISNVRYCPFTEWKNALENEFSVSLDSIKEIYVGDTPPDINNVIRSISFTDETGSNNDYGTIYYDNENVVSFVKVNPIVFPKDCSALFSDLPNCHTITINNVDLSMVNTMSSFVANNPNLTTFSVDDSFNTSTVSTFKSFFAGCEKLESVSFDSLGFEFDLLNSLESFFENCTSLESVDASYISKNTAPNLTNMQNMFSDAASLKSIDFSNVVFPSVATDPLQGFLSGVSESLEEMSLSANMASHIDESDLYRDSQGHTKGEWFCEGVNYGNSLDKIAETGKAGTYKIIEEHTFDDNGFCVCGGEHYQAPTVVTYDNYSELGLSTNYIGYYAIRNGGQLYWFSAYVNGFDSGVQHLDANAVLLNDIYVNTNVLSADGSLNSGTFRQWHPISLKKDTSTTYRYVGTFDGYGHTISGLYAQKSNYYVALFGHLANGGVIRRVGVIDSYFNTSYYAASICAKNIGTIENCYSNATVHISHAVAGGITAYNEGGTIKNCYFYGKVTADYKVGAIDGYGITSKGVITNCYYLNGCAKDTDGLVHGGIGNETVGVVTADVVGKTEARTAEQFASGEVTSKLNGGVVNGSQAFYQTLSTDAYPSFNGATVYENVTSGCGSIATYAYDNIDNDVYNHTYEGAYVKEAYSMEYQLVCARCDIPATLGAYSDSTLIVYGCLSPITGLHDTNMTNAMSCNKRYMVNEPSSIEGTEPEHSVAYTYSKTSDGVYLDTTDTSKVGYYKPYLVVNGNRYLCDSFYIKPGDTILKNDWKTNYVDCIGEVHIDGTLPVGYTMNDDGSITNGVNVVAPTDVSTGEKLTKAYLYEVDGNIYIVNSAEYSWYVNIKSGNALFSGMSSITALYLDNLDTTVANLGMANVEDFYEFANDCSNLENITFGDKFKLDVATDLRYMLSNNKVTSLDLSTWNVAKALENGTGTIANMLYGCNDLQQIILPYDLAVNLSQTGFTFNHVDAFCYDGAYYREVDEFESMVVDENVTYTLTAHTHGAFTNGFCDDCGGYQAPEKVEDVYQITNGGNLFWFAEAVNAGEYGATAVVTVDYIDLESYNGRVFPGIGGRTTNTAYTGYFNGNGATIENLYIENDANISDNVGFVNLAIGATVKNFTVKGSIVITKLLSNVAGVIGQAGDGTTVTDVNSYVNITTTHGGDNGDTSGTYYAGIIGFVNGNDVVIEKCAYYGTINTGASVCTTGGIAGHAGYSRNTLIKDSAFYGTIINTRAKSIIGGIVAYANTLGNIKIQNCLVVGTFEHNETVDEVDLTAFGTHNSDLSELTNSYYRTDSTILKVVKHEKSEVDYGVTATKVTDEQLASGEVAWLLNGGNELDPVWRQYVDVDEYPTFVGDVVYRSVASGCHEENFAFDYENYEKGDEFTHGETELVEDTKKVVCADCGKELFAYVDSSTFGYYGEWNDATAFYVNGTLPANYEELDYINVETEYSDLPVHLYQDEDGAIYIVNGANSDAVVYVENANTMFAYSTATIIDLTNLDFSECTDMAGLVSDNEYLETVIFNEDIDTQNVTDMSNMFSGCASLVNISGMTGFDTQNVTSMQDMFWYANSLETIDISSFDTSKVESMQGMFAVGNLKNIVIGENFTTENVKNMKYMFYTIQGMQWEDIKPIIERMDTSSVIDMSYMFGFTGFDYIDLSTFETDSLLLNNPDLSEDEEYNPTWEMFDNSNGLTVAGVTVIVPHKMMSMFTNPGLFTDYFGEWDDELERFVGDFYGWEITDSEDNELTYYHGTDFSSFAQDDADTTVYTLVAHGHENGGLYYVESNEYDEVSSSIQIYCPCGEIFDVITIYEIEDYEYTGYAIDYEPSYYTEKGSEVDVNFTLFYMNIFDENGEWEEVNEVKNVGGYKVVMSIGRATRSFEQASTYAEAEREFSVMPPEFYVVFEDFDGSFIYECWPIFNNANLDEVITPEDHVIPNNEYYTYTFKYWQLLGTDYTFKTEELTNQALFDLGLEEFTFRAVYDVTYNKQFHLKGSIDGEKTVLSESGIYDKDKNVKIVSDDEEVVTVYANYEIAINDGIAALLLIPEYDSRFTISAISINGQSVYGQGATSTEILTNWIAIATNDQSSGEEVKILLEYLENGNPVNKSTSEEIFVQIVYTMETVETGEYNFGFVTKYAEGTYDNSTDSDLSHNDRSEAYGVMMGDIVASTAELKITVDDANIIIVKREDTYIEMNQSSVVYDGKTVEIYEDADVTDAIVNVLEYHYGGCGTTLANGEEHEWSQYITINWYDENGDLLTTAPTDVGTYIVGISAEENDYYNAVEETLFTVTVTPYTIAVSAVKKNDKTYNGDDQTWLESDFTITSDTPALNGETGYTLELENATYKNAGTYTVSLKFTADSNYSFTENAPLENAGNISILDIEVVMHKFALTVTAINKESQYGNTLEQLTYALSATNENEDATFANEDDDLTIEIETTATTGSNVGNYDIIVNPSSANDNYDFTLIHEQDMNFATGDNGTYTITQKRVDAPSIAPLTYNGELQFPSETSEAYDYAGDKHEDAGNYSLTATLVSGNYAWSDSVSTASRTVNWTISPATLSVVIGTVTEDYGKTETEALATILEKTTAVGLVTGDSLSDLIVLSFNASDFVDDEGFVKPNDNPGYTIVGNASENSGNYKIDFVAGLYIVKPVVLESQLVIESIQSKIYEYVGSKITWTVGDFTLTSTLPNGEEITNVLEITIVSEQNYDYESANGKVDAEGVWSYYDPETKLYYTVTVKVKEDRRNAYSFGSTDEGTLYEKAVDVEVFIKQATNAWIVGPSVVMTDIETFTTEAEAKFMAEGGVVVVLKDSDGAVVNADQLLVGKKYTATFTVVETNDYTGLEEIINVELGYAYISLPTVYLDEENGTIVVANGDEEITYDGVAHKFVVATNEGKYTITVNTGDDYASWKDADGEYYITIALTDNYSWSEDDREDKTYTLVINRASLTITAKDETVTYRGVAPSYTTTEDKFVEGENYETYEEGFAIADYISCAYTSGSNVGSYDITFISNAETELEKILRNYDITLENGTLTVEQLELDLSDLKGQLDDGEEKAWATFASGLSVEYNADTHEVKVNGYPEELVPTITYSGETTLPKTAGFYTVKVVFNTTADLLATNFTWTDPSEVTLEITKVTITVTAKKQTTAYTGNNIEVTALQTTDNMSWQYTGAKSEDEIGFITEIDQFELTGLTLNGTYFAVGEYEEAIRVSYTFAEGVDNNYIVSYEDGKLIIEKENLSWEIELITENRNYDGSAIKEGMSEDNTKAQDYFAKLGDGAERTYLSYAFYASNETDAETISDPVNAGTYYVRAFYDDNIHTAISTGFVQIVINKAEVVISGVEDVDRNYLQDYSVDAIATKATLVTEDNYVPVVKVEYYSGDVLLDAKPLEVGTYTIKVTIENPNENYAGDEVTKNLTIRKATLNEVTFTYNLDTATWDPIIKSTDGEDINKYDDVTVTYKVDGATITNNTFKATATGNYVLVASVEGNDNFANSESEMKEVFSVTFADSALNHDRTLDEDATDYIKATTAATTQYRFSGEMATQPNFAGTGETVPAITGYDFADAWNQVEGSTDRYTFNVGVTQNLTVYAMWKLKEYTVTWMNDDAEIYQMVYKYKDLPVYGEDADGNTYSEPTRTATSEWIYTFIGWGNKVEGSVITIEEITDDTTYFAIYEKEGVTYTVTFMLSKDGSDDYEVVKEEENAKFGELLTSYYDLAEVIWFRGDVWYAQRERVTKVETVPVGGVTVYGSYVFDIGNGDVNANGKVNADDITLYRQWIVGGYEMTVVEIGTEWELVHSEGFAETLIGDNATKYFIKRVADVNIDTSEDIRDVTTVRMSIVGGYGYETAEGIEKAKVTGEAVVISLPELTYEVNALSESTTVVGNTITIDFEKYNDESYEPCVNVYATDIFLPEGKDFESYVNMDFVMYYPNGVEMYNSKAFFINSQSLDNKVGIEVYVSDKNECVNGTYTLKMRISIGGYAYDWQTYNVTVINNIIDAQDSLTYTVDTTSPYKGTVMSVEDDTVTVSVVEIDDTDMDAYCGFMLSIEGLVCPKEEVSDGVYEDNPMGMSLRFTITNENGETVYTDDDTWPDSPFACLVGHVTDEDEDGMLRFSGIVEMQFFIDYDLVEQGTHDYTLTLQVADENGEHEEKSITLVLVKE